MYATVRAYAGSGDLVDALVANESSVRQLISGIGGFRAYYLVRADGGEAVSVSVYDDRAGAEESNRVAAEWIRENVPDLAVSPPHVSAGEVAISI
jgi:hypothetical protein